MFVAVVGAQVKNSPLFFVQVFGAVGLLLNLWTDVQLGLFNDRPETEIHQAHHSFFSEST